MSESKELRPCPFCGGPAETDGQRAYRSLSTGEIGHAVAVYCTGSCSADMSLCLADVPSLSADDAMAVLIENWNRRLPAEPSTVPRDNYGRREPPHGYAYRYPSVTGGTVVSFDRMPRREALEAIPYWLGSPVPELPATGPLKLDTDRQVFFYEQDHYYLSNFSAFRLNWQGWGFDTSEAAYHWEKFPNAPEVRESIRFATSAHEAFKVAERYKALRRPDWDLVKVGIMKAILCQKALQHEYVSRKLLETGDRELIENSWRDDYWGWGPNRDGQNMLGKLWMEIRAELRGITGANV